MSKPANQTGQLVLALQGTIFLSSSKDWADLPTKNSLVMSSPSIALMPVAVDAGVEDEGGTVGKVGFVLSIDSAASWLAIRAIRAALHRDTGNPVPFISCLNSATVQECR